MPHFAHVLDGVVQTVRRIEAYVMEDDEGNEVEALGQQFLATLYPGTQAEEYVQTWFPVGQPEPYPRGKYAGVGDMWNGTEFIDPATIMALEPVEP